MQIITETILQRLMTARVASLFLIIILFFAYTQVFVPINTFPTGAEFVIKKNAVEADVYKRLEEGGFIRSAKLAKAINRFFPENSIQAGEYVWDNKMSLWEIMSNLRVPPKSLRIPIPEGFTKYQVAERMLANLKFFDDTEFLLRANEGYLFPDTYTFYTFTDTNDVLNSIESNYNKKIKDIVKEMGRVPTKDEIIIASLLQREVKGAYDMGMVSGIIQNRLKKGMLLQIDASVMYGQGRWKNKVFYTDLNSDTPYNVYKYKGLPVGPISNPGLTAIKAAMKPTPNKFIFYLSGRDGTTYYAETYEKHVRNKALYLR